MTHLKNEWELIAETTEVLKFFDKQKRNTEKYAALFVLSYE